MNSIGGNGSVIGELFGKKKGNRVNEQQDNKQDQSASKSRNLVRSLKKKNKNNKSHYDKNAGNDNSLVISKGLSTKCSYKERPVKHIVMGQYFIGDLSEVKIMNDEPTYTCSLIVMFSENTKMGALYHYPAMMWDKKEEISRIHKEVNPTQIVLYSAISEDWRVAEDKSFLVEVLTELGPPPETKTTSGALVITLDKNGKDLELLKSLDK